jgi:hypothetical protein
MILKCLRARKSKDINNGDIRLGRITLVLIIITQPYVTVVYVL